MNREYKTPKVWKVVTLIVIPPLCGVFVWLPFGVLSPFDWVTALFIIPFSVGMTALFIYGLIDTFVGKVIITDNSVKTVRTRGVRKLHFDEIKGIKSDENYVYVFPKENKKKALTISRYYEKRSEWYGELSSRFPDIDAEEYIKNEEELYDDEAYGETFDERFSHISKTKRFTKYLNYISFAASLWLWFYPVPYELATATGMVLPLVGLFFVIRSKGLIKVYDINNSPAPSLSSTLSMPPLVLMIRVLFDYDVLDYSKVWIYTLLITPAILLLIVKGAKDEFQTENTNERVFTYAFLAVAIGLFTFFSSISLNCTFDNSAPEKFRAKVIEKEISESSEGGTRYLLTLGEWREMSDEIEIGITERQYEQVESGSEVYVNLKAGLLGIPWVYVTTD